MTILVTDFPNALSDTTNKLKLQTLLPEAQIVFYPYESQQGLISAARNAEGILTAFVPIEYETLMALPNLKAISISATGCGNVSLDGARANGTMVCTLGEYCTEEVADHTLALLLAFARHLKQQDIQMACGQWTAFIKTPPLSLSDATLGIYGFGRIGRAVAKRAMAFGIKVLTLDRPSARNLPMAGVEFVSEEELLLRSDIISNHMPQTPVTENFFNRERFAQMEKHPIFLNLGRGASVDETALIDALDHGIISAAGLDVLALEAAVPSDYPLLHRDNVILTPHSAFCSVHTLQVLAEQPARNLAACLSGHLEQCRIRIV